MTRVTTAHTLRLRPILIGVIVDHSGLILFGIVYLALIVAADLVAGTGPLESGDLWFPDGVFDAIGLLFTVLGGYIAARMAGGRHLAHGAAVGAASLIVGIAIAIWVPADDPSTWSTALSMAAAVPAGAAGGYLALLLGRRAAAADTTSS